MATLTTTTSGRHIVQVQLRGKRETISLRGFSERQARTIKAHVEHLAAAVESNTAPPLDTARWLADAGDALHAKLARVGLVESRSAREATKLGAYLKAYIVKRSDLKPATIANLRQVESFSVKFFGKDRDLLSINRGDVKDWHRKLMADGYAGPTIAMHVKKMRQVFADAADRKLIEDNPFRAVKAGSMTNTERLVYVPAADIIKVIDACPDPEWRLVFALARFGGLRVPSETRLLRWTDIKWDEHRMSVRSPKTERHKGKALRIVPIAPELMPYLLDAHARAEEGSVHVIARLRGDNLVTTGRKIIERAGLVPWPRTFQNLRASCETDMAMVLPIHAACAFIGNSEPVARKHYLQVTDEHFNMVSKKSAAPGAAERAGKDRKDTEHQSENPLKTEGLSQSDYPQGESNSPAISAESLQEAHVALQQALHPDIRNAAKLANPSIRRATAKIRAALASSLRRPRGTRKGATA
jgi:integrase